MTRSRSMFFWRNGFRRSKGGRKKVASAGQCVACADKGSPMTVPVKILSVLTGLSLAGSVQARIWTNDRGATVVAVLVAVRDAEVDLKLQDGRIVAVPKNVFSGADQAYILEWVKSGGTLPDTDVGAENPPAQGASGGRYVPLEPNWDAPWPERAAAPGYLLVKAVQETDELSVYETDISSLSPPENCRKRNAWPWRGVLKPFCPPWRPFP